MKLCVVVFLLFLAVSSPARGNEDPAEKCKRKCIVEHPSDEETRVTCLEFCRNALLRYHQEQNPYLFHVSDFVHGFRSQHGRFSILEKFTSRSDVFRGIEDYRFAVQEAEPLTFVKPDHWDADAVIFIVQGKGTVKLVRPDERRSVNVVQGDILVVKAGMMVAKVNPDHSQKLIMAMLIRPVFRPGNFEVFYTAGPASFIGHFSDEIIEAGFNVDKREELKIFKEASGEAVEKISPEQAKSLSREEGGGLWPFTSKNKPYNIFEEKVFSNEFGQYFHVDSSKYSPLQNMNAAVSFKNITRGGMTAIAYPTRATLLVYVIRGAGYSEMVAPPESESESETSSPRSYRNFKSELTVGKVQTIPLGHPAVLVASREQNLEVMIFEIYGNENEIFPVSGKGSVVNKMEDAVKEAAFGKKAELVNRVVGRGKYNMFTSGPQVREEEGHGNGHHADA